MTKIFWIVFIALLFISCMGESDREKPGGVNWGETSGLTDSLKDISARIDSFFQINFIQKSFSGTVLFAEKGRVVYKNAFGYADYKTKDTLTTSSLFQLASVTKPLTAYGIMVLKNQGRLSYADSIRKFLPEFPYENISIHQLLIHRSGLPVYMYFSDEYWKPAYPDSVINNYDVIDLMIKHEPMKYYSPGQRYNYNNTNYCLLAVIIEQVTGKSYEDFMREEVFSRLGMSNTEIYNKEYRPVNNQEVKGYMGSRLADNTYLNGVVGDKGIYSSVEDLYKFDRALYNYKFFSREDSITAYQLGHDELNDNDNYGYGWRISKRSDGSKIAYHTGWWKGFRTYFIRELKTQKCIIVLSNNSRTGKFSTEELMDLFNISPVLTDSLNVL